MSLVKLTRGPLPTDGHPGYVDVTAKGVSPQLAPLAPTWDLVMASKHGRLTHDGYRQAYVRLLTERLLTGELTPAADLLHRVGTAQGKGQTVLCCYCAMDRFCHTHILIDFLCWRFAGLFEDGRPYWMHKLVDRFLEER